MQLISIIIPTLNESKNITRLLEKIFQELKSHKMNTEIIIVDDDSQDETITKANKYPVTVIVRKDKKGLASACVDGFNAAQGEIIVVLDSDLQHPPHKIHDLVDSINKGADIAIASRYTKQGSLGDISAIRKMISSVSTLFMNLCFPQIRDITDKGSGFFAFKKNIIQDIPLNPKGYKILLELLILCRYNTVVEIGYTFEKRHSGKSKLNIIVIAAHLYQLIRLFYLSRKDFYGKGRAA